MLPAACVRGGCARWIVASRLGSERMGSSTSTPRGATRWVRAPESQRRRRVAASNQAGSNTSSSSDEDPEAALKPSQTARARGGARYSTLPNGNASSKDDDDAGAAKKKTAGRRRTSQPKDSEGRREQRRRSSARKPWMTQSSVNLTAEEEQACGAAIQELLTIEAMATQLAEESIAAELRDEKGVGDPFAVDFGKKKKKSPAASSPLGVTPGIGRDTSSPAFRRELARVMGFSSPAQIGRAHV